MSPLVDFYRGVATDSEGRLLSEILAWDDRTLENVHDFIQWVFPLPEPSRFNRAAPLLTADDIAAFKTDAVLQANVKKAFERILKFLGLAETTDGAIVEGNAFASRAGEIWSEPNHNWLRITRILRSLTLLGFRDQAKELHIWIAEQHRRRRFPFTSETFRYWSSTVK